MCLKRKKVLIYHNQKKEYLTKIILIRNPAYLMKLKILVSRSYPQGELLLLNNPVSTGLNAMKLLSLASTKAKWIPIFKYQPIYQYINRYLDLLPTDTIYVFLYRLSFWTKMNHISARRRDINLYFDLEISVDKQ